MTTHYYNIDNSLSVRSTNYYNDYINNNSTTTGDYKTWNYYHQTTSTTSASFGTTYIGAGNDILHWREVIENPSEQELLRLREERIKVEEEAKKAKAEADEAARKARLLLSEYLDNENMKRLLNKEPLEVPSKLFGDIKYHIPISNGRIKALKENKIVTELCLTVKDSRNLPTDDIILTKLLHILHDEENVLRTANHFNNKDENLLARLN